MAGGNVSPIIATRDPPELRLTEEIFVDLVRRLAALLPLAPPPPPRRNVGVAPAVTGGAHVVLPVGHGWGDDELPWDGDDGGIGSDHGGDAYSGGWFGAVPASGEAMAALAETTVVGEQGEGNKDGEECSVCLEVYEAGDTLRTMPCSHAFHGGCILGWLAVSRLCPLCRFALPPELESDSETDVQDGDDGEVEDSSSDEEVEDSDDEEEDSDEDNVTLESYI